MHVIASYNELTQYFDVSNRTG